ncbi:Beta-1,4-galactosyltransferase 3 [Schistosoma japonicum]|uniref:Beta-1,4-galactosyltransferase n=1 Tax=Schistosoma japonicum TaxID=6182 RepID=A0A4Z2CW12_SCHJA|nr:Beta-1,4-galactosyltransferase 3 [Schistosoma japonicum]TNN08448.1 Beta-1,4-galactosyltransferase 3 [Schistosoma japonicum]TNN08449.1 Beta-1,4-galactosyltransferase 3 [Schistosoma japonicum]TNN08450.1 Beta-1,4-galactosyltransferase 3 [Schistosoma japonicum]TNN08451.1 Beta-1,4-galactosyltransferase 3 [Schistosoma japonicum]
MRRIIIFLYFVQFFGQWRYKLCISIYIITSIFFIIAYLSGSPSRIVYSHPDELIDDALCSLPEPEVCCPNKTDLDLSQFSSISPTDILNILNVTQHVCDGSWKPKCLFSQKIAIIIPYRDREKHLKLLLPRLHALMFRQNMPYYVFVIEQAGTTPFNRGLLLNVGVLYALEIDPEVNCFVFHDVDLLPEKSENLYLCDTELRHLSPAIDEFRYHPPFINYAGGVAAMSKENIFKINGFPTRHWGWGSEDDEFSARGLIFNLKLTRPPEHIGRYKAPRHRKGSISFGHQSAFLKFQNYLHDGLTLLRDNFYPKWKVLSLNNRINKFSLNNLEKFKIPAFVNQCTRENILSQLNLDKNSTEIVHDLVKISSYNMKLLNHFSRDNLFKHFIFDPTDLYNQSEFILKPQGNHTDETVWWFLHFYGWI